MCCLYYYSFSTHKIIVSLAVEAQLSEQSYFKSWLYSESQLCDLELFIQVSLDVVFLFSFFFLREISLYQDINFTVEGQLGHVRSMNNVSGG